MQPVRDSILKEKEFPILERKSWVSTFPVMSLRQGQVKKLIDCYMWLYWTSTPFFFFCSLTKENVWAYLLNMYFAYWTSKSNLTLDGKIFISNRWIWSGSFKTFFSNTQDNNVHSVRIVAENKSVSNCKLLYSLILRGHHPIIQKLSPEDSECVWGACRQDEVILSLLLLLVISYNTWSFSFSLAFDCCTWHLTIFCAVPHFPSFPDRGPLGMFSGIDKADMKLLSFDVS